jgi:hypothetical protein
MLIWESDPSCAHGQRSRLISELVGRVSVLFEFLLTPEADFRAEKQGVDVPTTIQSVGHFQRQAQDI